MTIGWSSVVLRFRATLGICVVVAVANACHHATRILTFEEYARRTHTVPYILQSQVGQGQLVYFGSRHSYDPADPQMACIEAAWRAFRPTLAFNEGGNPPVEPTRDAAIAKHGEAGLVRFLAARDRVPVRSLEPTRFDEVAYLLTMFSARQVKLFYVLREIPQMHARSTAPAFAEYEEDALELISRIPQLSGAPSSLSELQKACHDLLPDLARCEEVPQAWFDPLSDQPTQTFLNVLSRRLSEFRDAHIVDLLQRSSSEGSRVFAVIGASHVVMEEPVLRSSHAAYRVRTCV